MRTNWFLCACHVCPHKVWNQICHKINTPFHDGALQFKARAKFLRNFFEKKANYFSKMKNENTRHSWEWETDFEQSLWANIGEEESVGSLVDNENDETAREPKSKIKLVFRCFVSDFML